VIYLLTLLLKTRNEIIHKHVNAHIAINTDLYAIGLNISKKEDQGLCSPLFFKIVSVTVIP